jgi:anti-sigma B factor antagonist
MEIEKSNNGEKLDVKLVGEIDAMNANDIESELLKQLEGVKEIIFDLSQLSYISSAGLRVLLSMQKLMKKQGSMEVRNTQDDVMQIFKVSGFVRLLNIV